MKIIKTILCLFAAILLLLPFDTVQAWSSFRNEHGTANANTTPAKTPIEPDRAGTKWNIAFEQGGKTVYNSDPVITDTNIYVVCKSSLYQLDKSGTVCSALTLAHDPERKPFIYPAERRHSTMCKYTDDGFPMDERAVWTAIPYNNLLPRWLSLCGNNKCIRNRRSILLPVSR